MDKSAVIFGNKIDKKTIAEAEKSKKKYIKKFGDDSGADYYLGAEKIQTLDFLGAVKGVLSDKPYEFPENALIVGNIRMGFGHYRISIAMASCARALGYEPFWLDLAGFDTTGSKMIRGQNAMYSLASRISQKSKLFNRLVWEPLNSEGFKKIAYNAKDQKNSELLVPLFKHIPKNIPYIATHVWPSQAAIHAGLTNVVNAIPDNWPMGLHLSEGAIHAVQTPFAYFGYKTLNGFSKKPLKGIPESDIKMVGRYVDHELLYELEEDNARRAARTLQNKPMRFLLTVGGAGAGFKSFCETVAHLMPYVKAGKATVFINFGDHKDVFIKMQKKLKLDGVKEYFNEYDRLKAEAARLKDGEGSGVYAIYNEDIFQAVYSTNLLMPVCDVLITKPSELSFYPIPKIFMRHIGGHEIYGGINSREIGDGSPECPTSSSMNEMIDTFITDKELYRHILDRINELKATGYYNGGYECVKLATGFDSK
ncbi:MAG: hypothetical protein IJQ23_08450 [Clostridia bacterium]|nr:hypothetical protein [Clostridia bacterium]